MSCRLEINGISVRWSELNDRYNIDFGSPSQITWPITVFICVCCSVQFCAARFFCLSSGAKRARARVVTSFLRKPLILRTIRNMRGISSAQIKQLLLGVLFFFYFVRKKTTSDWAANAWQYTWQNVRNEKANNNHSVWHGSYILYIKHISIVFLFCCGEQSMEALWAKWEI